MDPVDRQGSVQRQPSHVSTATSTAEQPKGKWDVVRGSIVSGTLKFVGLKPMRDESRHRDAVRAHMEFNREKRKSPSPSTQSVQQRMGFSRPQASIRTSLRPKDAALVRHVTGYNIIPEATPPTEGSGRVQSDSSSPDKPPPTFQAAPSRSISTPGTLKEKRQMSIYSYAADKGTGRNQAIRTELKPDLWKLAYNSIKRAAKPPPEPFHPGVKPGEKSFLFDDDEEVKPGRVRMDSGDFVDAGSPPLSPSSVILPAIMEQEEEDFFGFDDSHGLALAGEDETDSALPGGIPRVERVPEPVTVDKKRKAVPVRRNQIGLAYDAITFSGGYKGGYGGLGAFTKLLHFQYKDCDKKTQQLLDEQLLHKRPYFTYWLMVVHVIIMVIALIVYGFAPYGWDLVEQRDTVRRTDLSISTVSKMVVPSVWGGPQQQDLVILGALFGPCMRRDRLLFGRIDNDRQLEGNLSGCCVRQDRSGCFQAEEMSECQMRFSVFYMYGAESNNTRAVCGTSPETCIDPNPRFFPDAWLPDDILTWPICRSDVNANASEEHLTCEVTSRPCCFGIQANCLITTREECTFLEGRFHQEAFLCSQVDCLNDICGLLPFARFNQPDQFYRLWLSLFLHAGLIHLLVSLLFCIFILRAVEKRLGWWRTAFIYLFSGIGGNLVSVYFVPYNPEVGPAGSILGIVAYAFVFLFFESRILERPWIELLKLALCVVLPLFLLGLFPFIDNFAHIGGFVFGLLLSGIIVPYDKDVWESIVDKPKLNKMFLCAKIMMIALGIPAVLSLFALFFVLFYLVQSTWVGFSFLNCIPFTSTLCIDQQDFIRERDQFIV